MYSLSLLQHDTIKLNVKRKKYNIYIPIYLNKAFKYLFYLIKI